MHGHEIAASEMVLRPASVVARLQMTAPPVYSAIERLEQACILRELTGRRRGKLYAYDQYLAILNEGTELS